MSDPETRSVIVEREVPYPPEKIWRALTQPHLIAEWLMANDFAGRAGSSLSVSRRLGFGRLPGHAHRAQPRAVLQLGRDGAGKHCHLDAVAYAKPAPICAWSIPGFRPGQAQAYGGAKQGWQNFLGKLEQVLEKEP